MSPFLKNINILFMSKENINQINMNNIGKGEIIVLEVDLPKNSSRGIKDEEHSFNRLKDNLQEGGINKAIKRKLMKIMIIYQNKKDV